MPDSQRSVLLDYRVMLLVVFIIASVLSIGYHPLQGALVTSVARGTQFDGKIQAGDVITDVSGMTIHSADDYGKAAANLTGGYIVAGNRFYDTTPNASLGITVKNAPATNLELGLDLQGGTRVLLKPKENATRDMIERVIATLQTRVNVYGLREIRFYPITDANGNNYVQIELTGAGKEEIDNLLALQGRFEARVPKALGLKNSAGLLQLGNVKYDFSVHDGIISINGTDVALNKTFYIEGIPMRFTSIENSSVIVVATVFDAKDIETVSMDPQRSFVQPNNNGYEFSFQLLISRSGAEKFAKFTTGIPSAVDQATREQYLQEPSEIHLYLDNNEVSSLRISSGLAGRVFTTPSVTGWRQTRDDALKEKLMLQSTLQSGALPVGLDVAKTDVISPTLGSSFVMSALYSALVAAVAVAGVVLLRYRNFKIVIPMLITSLSEIVIIFGIAAAGSNSVWLAALGAAIALTVFAMVTKQEIDIVIIIGALLIPVMGFASWTVDLSTIGGAIAAIGTGINQMIVITDGIRTEAARKAYTWKEKVRMSFSIIFASAATTISAMLPLIFIGVGLVRGFAVTTIIGVLVGVLVTRPAYARIAEKFIK